MSDINELLEFLGSPADVGLGDGFPGDYASDSPLISSAGYDFTNMLGSVDPAFMSFYGSNGVDLDAGKTAENAVTDPLITPPMDSPLPSFGSPSAVDQMASFPSLGNLSAMPKLNLSPEQASALLASAEANIHLMFPELVPAVERLRASLRAAQPSPVGLFPQPTAIPSPSASIGSPIASINVAWEGSPTPSTPYMDPLPYDG
ncbi:hypothetical protein HDU67_004088, partial [Dinochytrium kinnereticum]